MRRIVLALAGTVSGLVMLASYHTSLGAGTTTTGGARLSGPATVVPAPAAATGGTAARATDALTVDGATAQTRWGPVQVRVTLTAGRIVDVAALQHPSGNGRDEAINAYALPILHDEVLTAQSASIDHVTGATVTSQGYVASLQSALDQVHA